VLEEGAVAGEGQGEGVQAEGGRAIGATGAAGLAEVVADRAGRGEEDEGEVLLGLNERGVVGEELLGDSGEVGVGGGLQDEGGGATGAEAGEVVGKAIGAMMEGAAQVGDGGAEDEAGVVEGEVGLTLGEESALEVGKGLCHGASLVSSRCSAHSASPFSPRRHSS